MTQPKEGSFIQLRLAGSMALTRGYVYSKGRGLDLSIELFDGTIVGTNSAADIEKGSIIELAFNEDARRYDPDMGILTEDERLNYLVGCATVGAYGRRYGSSRQRNLFTAGDPYRHDNSHQKGEGVGWERLEAEPGHGDSGWALYPRIWHTPSETLEDRKLRVVITRDSDSERNDDEGSYRAYVYSFTGTYSVYVQARETHGWRMPYNGHAMNREGLNAEEAVRTACSVLDTLSSLGEDIAQEGYNMGVAEAKAKVAKALRSARDQLKQVFGTLKLDGEE